MIPQKLSTIFYMTHASKHFLFTTGITKLETSQAYFSVNTSYKFKSKRFDQFKTIENTFRSEHCLAGSKFVSC